ncbi:hypothetical protein [Citrobacter sp. wls711]|uniref:hypothetical protein n=1 Tax=Citrobacter sp. wls711 TaxID=2576425 RepID=UPI00352FBD16
MLNHSANVQASNADASIVLNRATLNKIILKEESLNITRGRKTIQLLCELTTAPIWLQSSLPDVSAHNVYYVKYGGFILRFMSSSLSGTYR